LWLTKSQAKLLRSLKSSVQCTGDFLVGHPGAIENRDGILKKIPQVLPCGTSGIRRKQACFRSILPRDLLQHPFAKPEWTGSTLLNIPKNFALRQKKFKIHIPKWNVPSCSY
jgi:hypothetical protein